MNVADAEDMTLIDKPDPWLILVDDRNKTIRHI
jgi:hypothetical protein